jgi:hypothetical protein
VVGQTTSAAKGDGNAECIMIRKKLPHYHTSCEIADLLGQPEALIRRMVHAKRCPGWIWRPNWREPRFAESSIPEWLRLLDEIDVTALPLNPPPLERPERVFNETLGATLEGMRRAG